MFREKCTVLENKRVAPGHYVLRLASTKIAKATKPGQFVQILCSSATDPFLPRPFSFLTSTSKNFSVLFHVIGKGTKLLSQVEKGDTLWATGPLGNGFTVNAVIARSTFASLSVNSATKQSLPQRLLRFARNDILLVGGGVGIPPLYHLAEQLIKNKTPRENIHVFLGARNKSLLLCEKDFQKLGAQLHLSTDNGSKGKKGFVTQAVDDFLNSRLKTHDSRLIFACGPTLMLKVVSVIARKHKIPCEVSVEQSMACGFGACLGCAVKTKDKNGTGHRFAMACSEGPVFHADQIIWD